MAWIELHQSLWTHKKTIMLAALLDIDELYAAAHMSKLWTWSLDNAQDGDLSDLPNRVIAFGAGWKGDADMFVEAIKKAGWIDSGGSIHDWFDYAGRLIEKKNANKDRMRNARATNVQRTNNARAGATLPNLTKPSNTTTTAHTRDCHSPLPEQDEPQTMMDAHHQVFGTNIIPSNHSKVLIPIMTRSGEAYAIELILEAGEAAKGGAPSIRYVQEIDVRWQKDKIKSREEAKSKKPQTSNRFDPNERKQTQNQLAKQKIREAEERDRIRSTQTVLPHRELI